MPPSETLSDEDLCRMALLFLRAKAAFDEEHARTPPARPPSFEVLSEVEVDLYHLKNLCQAFAGDGQAGEKNRPLDRKDLFELAVSSIFHEMLHLKEFVYTVERFRPRCREFMKQMQGREVSQAEQDFFRYSREIVDEAEKRLPKKGREVADLFQDALFQFEEAVKGYANHPAIVRTLYYNQELLDRACGKGKRRSFYERIYPGGLLEACFVVGSSFQEAGFAEEAALAYARALKAPPGKGRPERDFHRAAERRLEDLREGGLPEAALRAAREKAALETPKGEKART